MAEHDDLTPEQQASAYAAEYARGEGMQPIHDLHRAWLAGHAAGVRRAVLGGEALSADDRELLAVLAVGEAGHLERRWPRETERPQRLRALAARLRGQG